ncbi:DUF485 domain-containing protein [Nocardiopsis sp. YSL2]|uniref:DUF485 domain-containing protein n=1 Tax=Nocardiopsis sp. YSL2 TaxID=2939492 RepID=UPI0026F4701A|nr:DUF485 domain-containing protein [Nocardiopsis sp. YSL2]
MVEYMEGTYRSRGGGPGEAAPGEVTWSDSVRRRERADAAYAWERLSVDPRFVKLRRRFALQVAVLVSLFLLSYLTYLLLSAYARDVMSYQVADSVNVALLLGIGQFLLTFVLAWAFGRFSARAIDPLAAEIRDRARNDGAITGRVSRR